MKKLELILIKDRIKSCGLKQIFIAEKIGISNPHLTMMLNGNANMPETTRNKINELLEKVLI